MFLTEKKIDCSQPVTMQLTPLKGSKRLSKNTVFAIGEDSIELEIEKICKDEFEANLTPA